MKLYHERNRHEIAEQKKAYYERTSVESKKRQREYDSINSESKRLKQSEYNKENAESIKQKQRQYNNENSESIKRKQRVYDSNHAEAKRLKQSEYNRENAESIKEKQRVYNRENSESIREKQRIARSSEKLSQEAAGRILKFKQDIIQGPNFVCKSCNRGLFKNNVKILKGDAVQKFLEGLRESFLQMIGLFGFSERELIFCHNCHKWISKEKLPSIHVSNGLSLDHVPEELACLSDLEHQLIQPNLMFMKIRRLPKSRMQANFDRVISVPLDAEDVTASVLTLPRPPNEAKFVAVKLKRKLEMKSVHLYEYIRAALVFAALAILKALKNRFYEDVNIDTEALKPDENQDADIQSSGAQGNNPEDSAGIYFRNI